MLQAKSPSVSFGDVISSASVRSADDGAVLPVTLELWRATLEDLPSTLFFVKDENLRFVCGNRAMREFCGVQSEGDLAGRPASAFFPDASGKKYEEWERLVMRSLRPVKDQLFYSVRLRGRPVWLLLGCWPVMGARGRASGVASVARILEAPDRRHPTYERLARVVEHIRANFTQTIEVTDLARRAEVSVSQLERDFVSLFGVSPRRYITKVRLEAALELLREGGPIVDISHACGYSDQSAFTRRFRSMVGMSPTEYRLAQQT